METISEYQPILISLVKTHLKKEEEIRIPGQTNKPTVTKGGDIWWKWQKIWFGNNKQRKGSMQGTMDQSAMSKKINIRLCPNKQ